MVSMRATDILKEVFALKPPSNYKLRNQSELTVRLVKLYIMD